MKITNQLKYTVIGLVGLSFVSTGVLEFVTQNTIADSSVINQSGIVRGATQRLVKLETNGQPNDKLMANLDAILEDLINGDPELNLPKATDQNFIEKMTALQTAWAGLKKTIAQYRQNPSLKPKLIEDSEKFFELATEATLAAEEFAIANVERVEIIELLLLVVNLAALGFIFWGILQASKVLTRSISTVAGSSAEIAATVEAQGRLVEDQTSSVTQTTATIEMLGTASLKAAQQADSSATGAREALDLSETGSQAVAKTVQGIQELRGKVAAIAEQIMQLSEQTDQISTISELVADVADQTNMLALNAAVEAARAGEQGKGFAVVAGEIRKLADQSRDSAGKINTLVGAIQASINSTVMVTDEGNKTASAGIEVAENTADVFQQIAAAINEVYANSAQIAQSAKQQAVGVQQAVSSMNAINLGAKETVTAVSQVQASTEQLKSVAQELQLAV
jgi:methyl-accepting chemotaxis protein